MHSTYRNYQIYKRARRKFAFQTYFLLSIWLVLAVVQWALINIFKDARDFFIDYYYICFITFGLAILFFIIFIFYERLRFIGGLNFFISLVIVELQIVSVFALVARVELADVLIFFGICVVLLVFFVFVGSVMPREIDLTLDVAILFILGFVFLIVAVFLLMVKFVIPKTSTGTYLTAEIFISTMILLFVMYHAQTINGSRFAEMRLNDALLGSLILFHDFLIIYWLTFYWQFTFNTFDNLINNSKSTTTTESPVAATPGEAPPGEETPEETQPEEGPPEETTPGKAPPKRTTPGETEPEETEPEEAPPGNHTTDKAPPEKHPPGEKPSGELPEPPENVPEQNEIE